jgi:hypothetical protein
METKMKKFLILTTCAALLGSVSFASADPMNANARMMHKHHHHMMKKKMMKHGMMKHGMMKKDGMGDGMKKM